MEGKALKDFLHTVASFSAIAMFTLAVSRWADIATHINLISWVGQ
ncbi:hypothetical protein ACXHXM_02170